MANCQFEIKFPGPASEVLDAARSSIQKAHGTFRGDTSEGHFKVPVGIGDIEGSYTFSDGAISITITKKPLLVACSLIEKKLRGYLTNPPA